MKTYSLFALICFVFCTFTQQTKAQTEDLYQTHMQKALEGLNAARNASELANSKNLFERIAMKYTTRWQPVYYMAYSDVQMVFYNPRAEQNSTRLEEAKCLLAKLELFADVDESELHVLWAYYYNARITVNPECAQEVFGEVLAALEKSLALNPDNPRAITLRAMFNQYLPPFVQLKIDAKAEVEKAKTLFANEEKTADKPYWGAFLINMIKIEE